MIYNEINFEASPFSYHLKYLSRITIVRGDSATGKTYLYSLLEDLKLTETYQKIKLFNYKSEKFHESIVAVLESVGMSFDVRIIGNENFSNKILEPVLNVIDDVADTSELFMRSLQLYNLFVSKKTRTGTPRTAHRINRKLEVIELNDIQGIEEMKIGVIVRTVLRKMLEDGKVSADEVALMQTKEYSKDTFDIQYPLLLKAIETDSKNPTRYYVTPIRIYGIDYFLCSEWFEVPTNNDRPYLLKWLASHME